MIPVNTKNIKYSNIIVSLTTIPSRSPYILSTINSILNQTILPHHIYIGIPYSSLREPGLDYNFPKYIYNNTLINIIYYDKDDGPIMKLLTGLRESKTACNIITIDDDTIYEKHLIENLLSKSYGENNVYCTIGRNNRGIKVYSEPVIVRTLEGYGGVKYNSTLFNLDHFEKALQSIPDYIRLNDDLFISHYLKENNIRINCIRNNIIEPICSYLDPKQSNPLWILNKNQENFNKTTTVLKIFN